MVELEDKLKELSASDDVYWTKTIQGKLADKYGENLYLSDIKDRRNVVCLKNIANVLTDM